jgi:hypothetical protein
MPMSPENSVSPGPAKSLIISGDRVCAVRLVEMTGKVLANASTIEQFFECFARTGVKQTSDNVAEFFGCT